MKKNLLVLLLCAFIGVPAQSYGQGFFKKLGKAINELSNDLNNNSSSYRRNRGSNTNKAYEEAQRKWDESHKTQSSQSDQISSQSYQETTKVSLKSLSANGNDEVSFVVYGRGSTEEDAVKAALRDAVRATFMTFVSPDSIIFDKLSDNIATKTNGSIRDNYIVTSMDMPDGSKMVCTKAIVSISKVAENAKAEGASVEIPAVSFSRKIKIMDLEKKYEAKALAGLLEELMVLIPQSYTRKLTLIEPKMVDDSYLYFLPNESHFEYLLNEFYNNQTNLSTKDNVAKSVLNSRYKKWIGNAKNNYLVGFKVEYAPSGKYKEYMDLLIRTIIAIGMNDVELSQYIGTNKKASLLDLREPFTAFYNKYFNTNRIMAENQVSCSLRDPAASAEFVRGFMGITNRYFMDFAIKDNIGQISRIKAAKNLTTGEGQNYKTLKHYIQWREGLHNIAEGEGLFSPFVDYSRSGFFNFTIGEDNGTHIHRYDTWNSISKDIEKMEGVEMPTVVTVQFQIPQQDIDKYSDFKLVDE